MRKGLFLMVLAGCTPTTDFRGANIAQIFEFENNIGYQWQYLNDDISLRYILVGEVENYVIVETDTEYTMTFRKSCIQDNDPDCNDGEVVRSIVFTSNFAGVRIHEVDGNRYDTPIIISAEYARVGEVFSSDSNGNTYTSTFNEFVSPCPVRIPEWPTCAEFEIVSTGGDPAIDGKYWAVQDRALVAMEWEGQPGRWELSGHVRLD